MQGCELYSSGCGWGPIVCCCEHDNELLNWRKFGEFLVWQSGF